MMQAVMGAFRGAFSRIFSRNKARLLLSQWVGNFLLMLLAAGWLQIPDSHTWQFAFSMLSGVLLVVGFLWLYTATFRYLRPCPLRPPWWLSCLLLAGFIVIVVAAAAADCRRPGTRNLVCRLLELSVSALAATSSRLFQPGGLAGTYL